MSPQRSNIKAIAAAHLAFVTLRSFLRPAQLNSENTEQPLGSHPYPRKPFGYGSLSPAFAANNNRREIRLAIKYIVLYLC